MLPFFSWQAAGPATYFFSSWIFLKVLAVVYLVAFFSFALQMGGLIGSQGILPVSHYLQVLREHFGVRAYWLAPTLFWLNSHDGFLKLVAFGGAALSLLLFFGVAPKAALILLLILYLSLVVAGQEFMSFQWDVMLVEVGFLAIVFSFSPPLGVFLFWLLLFKLIFLSGAVKLLSGDKTWHNLTALSYHYETQPLPTLFSWYVHKLPGWFHMASAFGAFVIQLVLPFFIWTTRPLRYAAGFGIVFLELFILLTGNYTFFNILTISLTLFLFDDGFWARFVSPELIEKIAGSLFFGGATNFPHGAVIATTALIAFLSLFHILAAFTPRTASPLRTFLGTIAPLRLVNSYGLFAVMTTSRPEIVVEGSNDGKNWLPYEFKYKPGDLKRPPLWNQPHQPRLDWQMWFAALGEARDNPWFVNFAFRLLEGSPEVLRLLARNPFPDKPPKFVRAVLYDYKFSDAKTRKETGEWWQRTYLGSYLPPVSLQDQPR